MFIMYIILIDYIHSMPQLGADVIPSACAYDLKTPAVIQGLPATKTPGGRAYAQPPGLRVLFVSPFLRGSEGSRGKGLGCPGTN